MIEQKLLAQEIESWNNFEYSLREDMKFCYNMLSECQKEEEYSKHSRQRRIQL
jgi:hypothetical protein